MAQDQTPSPTREDAAKQLRAAFERARDLHQRAAWEASEAREVGHYERAARLHGCVSGLLLAAEIFGVALPAAELAGVELPEGDEPA